MKCKNCGHSLLNNQTICPLCGTNNQDQVVVKKGDPMLWYKILVWGVMFFTAAMCIAMAVMHFIGLQYDGAQLIDINNKQPIMTETWDYAQRCAKMYELMPALQGFDIFLGIFEIIMAAGIGFIWFLVVKRKEVGARLAVVVYLVIISMELLGGIIASCACGVWLVSWIDIAFLLVWGVVATLNHIFFNKNVEKFQQ